MRRRLAGSKGLVGGTCLKDTVSIYRVPHSLIDIHPSAIQPELVSVGPLHHAKGKLLDCESHKWWFLDALLSRQSQKRGASLRGCFEAMKQLEDRTRGCYDEDIPMSSLDLVEMMGVLSLSYFDMFVETVMYSRKNDPISRMPWLIPILTRDLLKLENQLPFFVLERLFDLTRSPGFGDSIPLLALKFFNLSFPRPIEVLKETSGDSKAGVSPLLSLFHLSFFYAIHNSSEEGEILLERSIQCTTLLDSRESSSKFKPQKIDNLLEIKFKNRVLQVPPITINDLTIAVFINCMALEQCKYSIPKYFTSYIAFMSCLIISPRDVGFLCADGIIASYSHDDHYIAGLFNKLGEKVYLDKSDCYLSKHFKDVEAYYCSHWGTFMRTYFSTPWSFISVVSAIVLLVLTCGQTVMAILSYIMRDPCQRNQHRSAM